MHPIPTAGDEGEGVDEPFPIWKGMSAFEAGETEAPPAGVIVVDPFCDYLGKRCIDILEAAGYAVVQASGGSMNSSCRRFDVLCIQSLRLVVCVLNTRNTSHDMVFTVGYSRSFSVGPGLIIALVGTAPCTSNQRNRVMAQLRRVLLVRSTHGAARLKTCCPGHHRDRASQNAF